jgi:peptidoglycan/LPS O-acetylase OafA/YrhL
MSENMMFIPGAAIGALLLSLPARSWLTAGAMGFVGFILGAVAQFVVLQWWGHPVPLLADVLPVFAGAGVLVGSTFGAITQWGKRRRQHSQ